MTPLILDSGLYTTVGIGKFAGTGQSRTLNIEWSNALTVSKLEGLGWQGVEVLPLEKLWLLKEVLWAVVVILVVILVDTLA